MGDVGLVGRWHEIQKGQVTACFKDMLAVENKFECDPFSQIGSLYIRKTVETYIGLCSLYRSYSFIGSPLIYRSHRSVSTLCRLVVGCHR